LSLQRARTATIFRWARGAKQKGGFLIIHGDFCGENLSPGIKSKEKRKINKQKQKDGGGGEKKKNLIIREKEKSASPCF